jgi:hypothetical protein
VVEEAYLLHCGQQAKRERDRKESGSQYPQSSNLPSARIHPLKTPSLNATTIGVPNLQNMGLWGTHPNHSVGLLLSLTLERLFNIVVKSTNSGTGGPGFKSKFHYLLAL